MNQSYYIESMKIQSPKFWPVKSKIVEDWKCLQQQYMLTYQTNRTTKHAALRRNKLHFTRQLQILGAHAPTFYKFWILLTAKHYRKVQDIIELSTNDNLKNLLIISVKRPQRKNKLNHRTVHCHKTYTIKFHYSYCHVNRLITKNIEGRIKFNLYFYGFCWLKER